MTDDVPVPRRRSGNRASNRSDNTNRNSSFDGCPICKDTFVQSMRPRMLPCQHCLCLSPCLEGLVQISATTVVCPYCKEGSPKQAASTYPKNRMLENLMEVQDGEEIQIFVKTLTDKNIILFVRGLDVSVESVKAQLFEKEGIAPEHQMLMYTNKMLESGHCLNHYGVKEGCTLHLMQRQVGGTPWRPLTV